MTNMLQQIISALSSWWAQFLIYLASFAQLAPKTITAIEETTAKQDTVIQEISKKFDTIDIIIGSLTILLICLSIAGSLQKFFFYNDQKKEKKMQHIREILSRKKLLIISSNEKFFYIIARIFKNYGMTNGDSGNITHQDSIAMTMDKFLKYHIVIIDFDTHEKNAELVNMFRTDDDDVIIIGVSKNKIINDQLTFTCKYPFNHSVKLIKKICKHLSE